MKKGFALVAAHLAIAGCGPGVERMPDPALAAGRVPAFSQVREANLSATKEAQARYSRVELEKALRIVAQTLVSRDPSMAEIQELSGGTEAYKAVVQRYLDDPAFRAAQLRYFRNVFEMSGLRDGINFDEPANLAVYLVANDHDFREVLTADYCVDNMLNKIPCSTFSNAADQASQAAGVLTTQAFLKKWDSPFNFRRVDKAFRVFSCREYPDARDEGLTQQEISDRIKPFNSTTESPVCFNCHRSMNPRAALFYKFDRQGRFNPNPNPSASAGEIALTDTGAASTVQDVIKPGVVSKYHGQNVASVREYALYFSRTQYFRDCLAQRLINQLLGRSMNSSLPHEMQDIRDNVGMNEFKVKKIFLEIALHPSFVQR